jgi:hypothetical protein
MERKWIELLRTLTPEQRLNQVLRLNNRARALQLAGIRMRHPNADEREIRLRLASTWLDRDTMIKVFGWDPETHGLG